MYLNGLMQNICIITFSMINMHQIVASVDSYLQLIEERTAKY